MKPWIAAGLLVMGIGGGDAKAQDSSPQAPFVEDRHTVLLMHFDEGKGNPNDSSDFENHGVIKGGVTWVKEGKFGGALSFDGETGFVDCGSDESLALEGPMTLEAWVKPVKPDTGDRGLLGRSGGIAGGYMLFYEQHNSPYAYLVTADQGHHYVPSEIVLAEGQWQFLAMTFDGVNTVKWYLNGKRVKTDTESSSGKIVKIACRFIIGMYGGDRFYKGLIDEVRVSDSVRDYGPVETAKPKASP